MILQALNSYYERMIADPESGMPPYGTSVENISFALVLDTDGALRGIEDLRQQDGKNLAPRRMIVPVATTRSSQVKAYFAWDKAKYVLGNEGKEKINKKEFLAFKELFSSVCSGIRDDSVLAVQRFLDEWQPEKAEKTVSVFQNWKDVASANMVFRLEGTKGFIHDRPLVKEAWLSQFMKLEHDNLKMNCLVTGAENFISKVHLRIKGVWGKGAKSSGASIVAFNESAYESYGKKQSANAPVSIEAAFNYVTALNFLLEKTSRQKVTIGDTTIVFWSERSSPAEDFLADLFDVPPESDEPEVVIDQSTSLKIYDLLSAIRSGKRPEDIAPYLEESVRFYLLGLAPNAARLSIRFWEANTIGGLLQKIGRHFHQLQIIRRFDNEPEFPPLWRLLLGTAPPKKEKSKIIEQVLPVLIGGMTKAMLTGLPYPHNLLPVLLSRIKSEQSKRDKNGKREEPVTYFRAALIKAFLMRNKQMEVSVALDLNRTDPPYLFGRLFAVLERAQEKAVPGANVTIKDRFIGSASVNPSKVFPTLLRGSTYHIAKLRKNPEEKSRAICYEGLIQDIVAGLSNFPATMSLEEQGLFMIGYYHQRKDFFTKKNKEN